MEKTRTENAVLNSVFSIISKLTTVLLSFIVRTVFVRVLTKEYLGLNGLFSNIITMLSLVDLGIGIAIPYSLYKPLAEKDEDKINALMRFYTALTHFDSRFLSGTAPRRQIFCAAPARPLSSSDAPAKKPQLLCSLRARRASAFQCR